MSDYCDFNGACLPVYLCNLIPIRSGSCVKNFIEICNSGGIAWCN